jgi:cyclopropane-fatty-acyl-phospholipid synthase
MTTTQEMERTYRCLDELFGYAPPENVSIQLWDGTLWPDERFRQAVVVLKHPGALREMFSTGTEKGLAEAFLRDDFDIVGNTETAVELADIVRNRTETDWLGALSKYYHLTRLPARPQDRSRGRVFDQNNRKQQHSLERDREAISFHYDLSNDFYSLWLDRQMVYSCAYFEQPEYDLERAQTAKLRHICRKLRLRPGQRVLDIGCGWGAFAIHAARQAGVKVTGITLSERQAEFATARVQEAGLSAMVKIELRDYRELSEYMPYDAIVSIGMAEHVGPDQLPVYFKKMAGLLKPGGVFLNQAIGESIRPRNMLGPTFIDEYVFPDGDVPALPRILAAAETAGLEVRDVENLREHYTMTVRQWLKRLEASHEAALALVDEATYRIWRLYLAGSAHGFNHAHIAVYQTLLSKPGCQGQSHMPMTRSDWYA